MGGSSAASPTKIGEENDGGARCARPTLQLSDLPNIGQPYPIRLTQEPNSCQAILIGPRSNTRKAAVDAKRGKVWSKLAKAIIVAAKHGGGDPDMNLRLRYAIDDAKAVGMPKDNIQRAIKRGTGELDGGNLDEVLYEGYGAGGVAVLCEVLTDNRNRTAPEIRKIFELSHGKLGNTGCVAWMFESKGLFIIPADKIDEDKLLEIALEAGADDVRRDGDNFDVTCDPAIYRDVGKALADAGIQPEASRDHADCPRTPSTSTPTTPGRCSSSWSGWTTTTTCRTWRRTSTSPTRSWRKSARSKPANRHEKSAHDSKSPPTVGV